MRATALLRRLAAPIYLPILFAYLGLGMLVVVLPLYLTDEGLDLGTTALVLAASGAGAAVGSLPVGGLIAKIGERATMMAALVVMAAAVVPLSVSGEPLVLMAAMFASGLGTVAFLLSAQTFVTLHVDLGSRGRAMSYMGGAFRFSFLVGPLMGGLLVDAVGYRATFALIALAIVMAIPPVARSASDPAGEEVRAIPVGRPKPGGLRIALMTQRSRLVRMGMVQLLVMLVREGRLVILPLISDELGLSASQTGLVVAVSTAADLLLFPLAGAVMDRFGRLYAAVPSFALFTVGLVLLGLADSSTTVVVAGAVIGVGNGLGSGTMLTMSSDLAPAESPGPFLSVIAAIRNLGRIIGPLAVGFVGQAVGLDGSAFVLAALMAVAIAWILLVLGETSKQSSDEARA